MNLISKIATMIPGWILKERLEVEFRWKARWFGWMICPHRHTILVSINAELANHKNAPNHYLLWFSIKDLKNWKVRFIDNFDGVRGRITIPIHRNDASVCYVLIPYFYDSKWSRQIHAYIKSVIFYMPHNRANSTNIYYIWHFRNRWGYANTTISKCNIHHFAALWQFWRHPLGIIGIQINDDPAGKYAEQKSGDGRNIPPFNSDIGLLVNRNCS